MEFVLIVLVVVVGLGVLVSKNKDKIDAWAKEAEEKKKAAQEKRNYQRTLQGKQRKQTLDEDFYLSRQPADPEAAPPWEFRKRR